MKNYSHKLAIIIGITYFLGISACKKQTTSNSQTDEENELITAVNLMLIDSVTKDTQFVVWSQAAGPGSPIVVDSLILTPNSTYEVFVSIIDGSKTPVFDVSSEIKADANHHRFVYSSSVGSISTQITDFDSQVPPMELGLEFKLKTSFASQGKFTILLKHYTESSPKSQGIQAGSTDIDLSFPFRIR